MKLEFRVPPRWVLVSAGAAVAFAAATLIVWSSSGGGADRRIPPTRARVYSQQQACLLTSARGLADAAVSPVWAGMQEASAKTKAQVSYLAVAGEQSAANAAPYLASLAANHCDVVLTVGSAPAGAVVLDGPRFPHTRFLVIGRYKAGTKARSNVSVVATGSADDTRSAVETAVVNAVRN
jgi:basic membrane lipoprotein Med (substrate-binding protein (PBP1-ABC) superfamily)